MNWILEIFADKSDQARLVAILISGVVAISVVLLNQKITSNRSKRELLIEKIEELYLASNEYISACSELLDHVTEHSRKPIGTNYDSPRELVNNLNDSITKMQMICGLYFKAENFPSNKFYMWNMPIFENTQKRKHLSEDEAFEAHDDSIHHISVSREYLDDLCKKLMKAHGH